ncbi:MAG TPA: DUF465 domain-containing protein [Candidatus Binatia bacterium]|jgi:uncharacterized protein YdcH (DUF465 family)|nr:DUF465 domain-containing protein [Candidatus Binatia bacterium]
MESREEQAIVSLLDKDSELKKYYEEHQELEKKLSEFHHKHRLSPDEEVEMKRLQKLKLVGKDKIMEILGRYRQRGAIL